jgi:enoyl-CoA hydratase/carnithine racemase
MSTTDGVVRLDQHGAVAHITFDRPASRNAMTWAMYDQLVDALSLVEGATDMRLLVLRGAGGCFVAGTDIAQFTSFASAEDGIAYEKRLDGIIDRLENIAIPTLAVIEHIAAGGGLAIAAACDMRICTPDTRFGAPIARTVGNCLSVANLNRLIEQLGVARTKALLLTAGFLSAEDAHAAGFVMEVLPPDRLDTRVAELCERIAAHAPITLQVTKQAVRRLRRAALPDDEDLIRRAYGSRDFQEGVRAFLEKRAPRWEAR